MMIGHSEGNKMGMFLTLRLFYRYFYDRRKTGKTQAHKPRRVYITGRRLKLARVKSQVSELRKEN